MVFYAVFPNAKCTQQLLKMAAAGATLPLTGREKEYSQMHKNLKKNASLNAAQAIAELIN